MFNGFLNPDCYLKKKRFENTNQFISRHPSKWTEYIHLRKTGREKNVPYFNKIQLAEKIRECGFRTPKILRIFDDPCELDFTDLPDAFVLKPSCLWGSRGVMLLHRCAEKNKFLDLMGNRRLTLDLIRTEQSRLQKLWYQHRKRPFQLIVEEIITGENGSGKIPFDYKLFTFDGEVRFIVQVDRNVRPRAMAWFLNEFEIFDYTTELEVDWTLITRAESIIPGCHKEIVAAAKMISRSLCTPFVSVDFYATLEGPVIGELEFFAEPKHGKTFKFKQHFDEELGMAWKQADDRLGRKIPVMDIVPALKPQGFFH